MQLVSFGRDLVGKGLKNRELKIQFAIKIFCELKFLVGLQTCFAVVLSSCRINAHWGNEVTEESDLLLELQPFDLL